MADLQDMPGILELRGITLGHPDVRIALIDGLPDVDHEVFASQRISILDPSGLRLRAQDDSMRDHSTFVSSVLIGGPESQVPGVAPGCSLTVVLAMHALDDFETRLSYVRGLEAALETGAQVVHSAIALPSQSGKVDPLVERAAMRLRDAGVLLVAPTGNDHGTTWTFPATADYCLAVGSVDDHGDPVASTNHGEAFDGHGVMANGTRILGAAVGGGTTRQRGTSCAAAFVSGVAALLMSALRERELEIDAQQVGRAIIASARPHHGSHPERCIGGHLDPVAAWTMLRDGRVPPSLEPRSLRVRPRHNGDSSLPPTSPLRFGGPHFPQEDLATERDARSGAVEAAGLAQLGATPHGRRPAAAFVLGRVDVDIPNERTRAQLNGAMVSCGLMAGADDRAALASVLRLLPDLALEVSWVIRREEGVLYKLEIEGPLAGEIRADLVDALAGSVGGSYDRVSVPGLVTRRTATLANNERVPVLQVPARRGLYAWNRGRQLGALKLDQPTVRLLGRLLDAVERAAAPDGTGGPARALGFLTTNPAQLVWSANAALALGMEFAGLRVSPSILNRPHSDCWDVALEFRDADDTHRAAVLHRHSIDVGDLLPVSIGSPQSWRIA